MIFQKKLVSMKKLEMKLQNLQSFIDPKPELEQYPITPRGASLILSIITNTYNDIQNKIIADLGCGTGILAIGAALLGAKQVIGVDVDQKQLDIASQNANKFNLEDKIKWIRTDIQNFSIAVDVIIQNPPFGIQKRDKRDVVFLKKAIEYAKIIYSIHKSGKKSQIYLRNIIQNQNALIDAIIPIQILIPHLYNFHKKKQYPVKIDLYRILL
ncbi:MAG: METTL5 family protein [Promethearchaeota archaeon]